ncbi:hypothetical protein [Cyanobium sp. Morenito 9A2]|uniref:hypothetical protein n=1 Tax=Cyanobium sp. Morenito 9A2 TaxID=2823718 RepID=UPI0020CFAA83|nr:hypothetical protein [Cyanobium sp. Morenito 9A2]MCP9848889.1 hypothetical protein [Cyanobium sp. Morenito 9A2]
MEWCIADGDQPVGDLPLVFTFNQQKKGPICVVDERSTAPEGRACGAGGQALTPAEHACRHLRAGSRDETSKPPTLDSVRSDT